GVQLLKRRQQVPESKESGMSNVGSAAGGYRVENPATGEVVEKFDYATDEQIDQVLDAAHKGYLSWRDKTIEERAAIVDNAAALFGERKDELGAILAVEMGKPAAEDVKEAELCEAFFHYHPHRGQKFAAD